MAGILFPQRPGVYNAAMQPAPAPTPTPASVSPEAPAPGSGRTLARLMITLTAAFVIAMVSVLFYRWVTLHEPKYVLIVNGTSDWVGANVTVDGAALAKPFVRSIGTENGLKLPFYLDQGTYLLTIERGGSNLIQAEVLIARGAGVQIDLESYEHLLKGVAASQPATAPAGEDNAR